jgi:hypothetical protein
MFMLIVDDFGIQFTGKHHVQHLIAALKQDYEAITTDWDQIIFWHQPGMGLSRAHGGPIDARVCCMGAHRLCAHSTIMARTSTTLTQ